MFFTTKELISKEITKEDIMQGINSAFTANDVEHFCKNDLELVTFSKDDNTFGTPEIKKWLKQVVIPVAEKELKTTYEEIEQKKIQKEKIVYHLNALQTLLSVLNKLYKNDSQTELEMLIPFFKKTVFNFEKPVTNMTLGCIQDIVSFEAETQTLLDEQNMLILLKNITNAKEILPKVMKLNCILNQKIERSDK